ncbi:MAG: WGR domain-containing protein [Planctomycetaceae bacterium]|nr:WGR domain-containing protein [Planctomycetaceae bacterium]
MTEVLYIALEAHNPTRNHHRRYVLVVERDLLGDWLCTVEYGRVGQGGTLQRYASARIDDVRRFAQRCLNRRLSAPRRIGVPYRCVEHRGTMEMPFWLLEHLKAH